MPEEFSLPNVGPGPDPCSLASLAADHDFVLLLFQRDYHCINCRKQVQQVKSRYDEFTARNTEVASIVPEPREKVQDWQDSYDLPYPLFADADAATGDAYDQPVRYGILGRFSDFFGRMPEAVLLDARGEEPEIVWSHAGKSTFDRPDIDEILAEIDAHRADASP
ncbi:peroxiredoxin [Haloarchaeobius sp. HME9146]|uniref:peroxiredoxin family protein n=1 Tax=Haloarchaeobius sp. HME9146 TaxID=2978732 RepID=UPI0021BFF4F5|nr:peroxiredoxin family protein [Haloarchaeobius sp. HME9146]MCT9095032.1 peroxiredoxin family protein [Haloarchaeobius sp. HME9146]